MLSIIVPVYNVEKYLDACLLSVEKQTATNFEVVIVNDGSTDNSEEIIKKFCKRNSNFFYFNKKNEGLMSAYLYGIEKSNGDYIGFVDSDDFIHPDFVKKMYDQNVEHADIVICNRFDVGEDGVVLGSDNFSHIPPGMYDPKNNEIIYSNIFPPFSGWHITNARWNKIFKKDIVLANLKYLESKSRIMEDRFFTPACMFSAKRFKVLDEKLYFYRRREYGSNHSLASPNLYAAIKLLMKTQKNMLIEKDIYSKYKLQYELACLNYLALYIERNLFPKQSFSKRISCSQMVIKDKEFQLLVKKHHKYLKYKKGKLIKISYFFKSPFIMSLLTMLKK